MTQELGELQRKGRESLEENAHLRKSLEELARAKSDIQSAFDDLVPKHESLMVECRPG